MGGDVWLLASALTGSARAAGPAELAPFLQWHCSSSNWERYDGRIQLAPLPDGVEPRRPSVAPGDSNTIGVSAAGLEPEPEHRILVAIARDAPVERVSSVLAEVGAEVYPPEVLQLLFAVPDAEPRPPVPQTERESFAKLEEALAHTSGAAAAHTMRGWFQGRCDPVDWRPKAILTCEEAVDPFARFATRRRCRPVLSPLLVWWSHEWGGTDPGVPVAQLPIWSRGADALGGEGTWGELAADFVAKPQPAMSLGDGAGAYRRDLDAPNTRKRVMPQYPGAAKALNLASQKCLGTVWIDASGVPAQVEVDGCPKVFHATVEQTLLQWRWHAAEIDGQAVPFITTIAVIFNSVDR